MTTTITVLGSTGSNLLEHRDNAINSVRRKHPKARFVEVLPEGWNMHIELRCRRNVIASSAIKRLIDYLLDNGIVVSFVRSVIKNKKIIETVTAMNETLQGFVNKKNRRFIQGFLLRALTRGYVVYTAVPTEKSERNYSFLFGATMAEDGSYDIVSAMENNTVKFYAVPRMMQDDILASDGTITTELRPKYNELFICVPFAEDGDERYPLGPLERVVPYIDRLDHLDSDFDSVEKGLAYPTLALQAPRVPTASSSGGYDPMQGSVVASTGGADDTSKDLIEKSNFRDDEHQRERARQEIKEWQKFREGCRNGKLAPYRTYDISDIRKREAEVQAARNLQGVLTVTPGCTLTSVPAPSLIPSHQEEKANTIRIIDDTIFGLGTMQASSRSNAGNTSVGDVTRLKMFNNHVTALQDDILPYLEQIFENIWKEYLVTLGNMKGAEVPGGGDIRGIAIGAMAVDGTDVPDTDTADAEAEVDTDASVDVETDADVEDDVYGSTRVRIGFTFAPMTSAEELDALLSRGVIDQEHYGKLKLQSVGLQATSAITPEQRLKAVILENTIRAGTSAALVPGIKLDSTVEEENRMKLAKTADKKEAPEAPKEELAPGDKRKRTEQPSGVDKLQKNAQTSTKKIANKRLRGADKG